MASIVKKSFDQPDEVQTPPNVKNIKMEAVTIDGIKVQRITVQPGWKWSVDLKPIVKTDSCQMHHHLYILSGKLATQMTGGDVEEFGAGDVIDIPPGHNGWTIGNTPAVWLELPH